MSSNLPLVSLGAKEPLGGVVSRKSHTGRWWSCSLIAVIVILLFLAPLYVTNSYYIRILVLMCIYGAASTGWNLLGGYANQVSLGHAVFFGIGAYSVLIAQSRWEVSPWLGIALGVLCSLIVAIVIGWPTFQLSGHYFALGTLALLEMFNIVATVWKGLTSGPVGLTSPILPSSFASLQFDTPSPYLYLAGIFLVLTCVTAWWVRHSKLGLRLEAIRLNPHAALLAGVSLFRTKMTALLFSAGIVAIAGSLYAVVLQFIDPNTAFSFQTTVNMALFAIIGGLRLWWGPLLGAVLLVPLSEVSQLYLTGHLSALAQVTYGLLLVVLILLQPRGIGGWLNSLWQRATARRG